MWPQHFSPCFLTFLQGLSSVMLVKERGWKREERGGEKKRANIAVPAVQLDRPPPWVPPSPLQHWQVPSAVLISHFTDAADETETWTVLALG